MNKEKIRVRGKIALFSCFFLLASCGSKLNDTPPGAASIISATSQGLGLLFKKECIEGIHLSWLLSEGKRQRARYCGGFMSGEGERGDCESERGHSASWRQLTSDHSELKVELEANPKLSQLDSCKIEVSDHLSSALREVAFSFVKNNSHAEKFVHEEYKDGSGNKVDEVWVWSSSTYASKSAPQLKLERYKPAGKNFFISSLIWISKGTFVGSDSKSAFPASTELSDR